MDEEKKDLTIENETEQPSAEKKEEKKPAYDLFGITEEMPEPDPSQFIDNGNYFVYGLAIGILVGAALFFLFGQNRILLCVATVIGGVVGSCLKKKG